MLDENLRLGDEPPLDEDRCWRAVLERDRDHDGRFFTGVVTTGIFCRPSCPARHPLRKNVRFFPTAEAAIERGLRPCRRCRPLDAAEDGRVDQMRDLCAYIRRHCDSGDALTLEVLARRAGMSDSRLRRMFKEIVGVTPRQFVEVCRFENLRTGLREMDQVTSAIYEAGFGSSSRVYEQTGSRLGMTPGEYSAGGRDTVISYVLADTAVGRMLVAATDRGLCWVQFGASDDELVGALRREYPAASIEPSAAQDSADLRRWLDALQRHLEGGEPHLDLPVDVRTTAFRERVWQYLRTIPYGETRSYGEVARAIGKPAAVRAVASACGANPTAVVVPCHRVIRADGSLGGYRSGIERKKRLLERERVATV